LTDFTPISTEPTRVKLCAVRAAFVIVGLVAWFGTQALLGARPAPAEPASLMAAGAVLTQGDGLLELSRPMNVYLHEHRAVANGLLIVSSAMIDVLGIALLGWSVFGASVRPFVGLLVLFGLRQLTQVLCALPAPVGMIWPKEGPGFPSLLVTYTVANDFFFSGHTAIAVFGAIELCRFVGYKLRGTAVCAAQGLICLGAIFLVTVVLLLRAHYTMDVFAGVLAATLAAIFASRVAPRCDVVLCWIIGGREHGRSSQP
jgi:hypothetical protein